MQREKKFRAWDTKLKQWCYFDDATKGLRRSKNGTIRSIAEQHSVGVIDNDGDYNDNLIWLEYTGLKDKNNKEIYQGDIAKIYYKGAWVHVEIFWNELGMWCFKWPDGYINNYPLPSNKGKTTFEIVGNIHENPKLLKK